MASQQIAPLFVNRDMNVRMTYDRLVQALDRFGDVIAEAGKNQVTFVCGGPFLGAFPRSKVPAAASAPGADPGASTTRSTWRVNGTSMRSSSGGSRRGLSWWSEPRACIPKSFVPSAGFQSHRSTNGSWTAS
mgnify:CR=1 FL=1